MFTLPTTTFTLAGKVPTVDLYFSEPVIQYFPLTATGFAHAVGDAAASPSYIWSCQETSGNLIDSISSAELSSSLGSSTRRAIETKGLYNGSDFNRYAIGDGTSGQFQAATGSLMDSDNTSVAYIFVFQKTGVVRTDFFFKNAASLEGILMRNETDGTCRVYIKGATSGVWLNQSENLQDGAWHYVCVVADTTAGTVYNITDKEEVTANISTIGTMTNTDNLEIARGNTTHLHISYVAAFEGAAAEALTKAKLDSWWKHASDPTGLLTTQSRNSLISGQVSPTTVAHFAPDTLPIVYNPAFRDKNKFGLYCNTARTNYLADSEDFSSANWTITNSTRTADDGDSPDGFRSATTVTATAAAGYIRSVSTLGGGSIEHTFSTWIKTSSPTVAGQIRLWDADVGSYIGTTAFTATADWQLISTSGTPSFASPALISHIEITTNGESILIWGAQLNEGNHRGAYIRTDGAAASLVASSYIANGDYIPEKAGRIEAKIVKDLDLAASSFVVDSVDTSDQKTLELTSTFDMLVTSYDSDGVSETTTTSTDPALASTEQLFEFEWDNRSTGIGGYESRQLLNNVELLGALTMSEGPSSGSYTTGVNIGSNRSTTNQLNGSIQYIRVYESEIDNVVSDLDFSQPVVQQFPTTATGLATLLGDVTATPNHIWVCDEVSGSLVDTILSTELSSSNSPLQGQVAVGLGNTLINRAAIEATSTTTKFEASSSDILDSSLESIAFLVVFRTKRSGTDQYLIRKRLGGINAGYYLRIRTDGAVWMATADGTNTDVAQALSTHDDGAWHIAIGGYHDPDDTTHIHTDVNSDTTILDPPVLGMQNSGSFTLFDSAPDSQISYVASFTGTAAEVLLDLGAAAVTSFWKHATDPTGLLATSTRGSAISVPVADGFVAHYSSDTIATAYDSSFSGPTKFGLACNTAITNIVSDSEDFSAVNWIQTNSTITSNDVNAPDGFRSATTLTATAASGYQRNNCAVSASTEYTKSCWVRRSGGSDVAAKVRIYDIQLDVYTTVSFTATATWTLQSVTATTGASTTNIWSVLTVDTNGEAIEVWGDQVNTGSSRGFYVRTVGAAASLVASVNQAPFTTNTAVGEIEANWIQRGYETLNAIYNVISTGNINRKRLYASGTTTYTIDTYDAVGSSEDSIVKAHSSTGVEHIHRHIWDQSAAGDESGGFESVSILDGVVQNGTASPFDGTTGGADTTLCDIGCISTTFQSNSIIQRIRSYKDVNGGS